MERGESLGGRVFKEANTIKKKSYEEMQLVCKMYLTEVFIKSSPNSLRAVSARRPLIDHICHGVVRVAVLPEYLLHHAVRIAHHVLAITPMITFKVHCLADASLFKFDLQSFTKRLLAINYLYGLTGHIRTLIAHKAVSFRPPRILISHDTY